MGAEVSVGSHGGTEDPQQHNGRALASGESGECGEYRGTASAEERRGEKLQRIRVVSWNV
jgi:hypothetical protein